MATDTRSAGPTRTSTLRSAAAAVGVAAVASSLLDLLVAAVAHAAGAPSSFQPLTPGPFISFGVIGTVLGAVGWSVIRARAARPAAVLRVLVPAVVLVSFVPDLAVGAAGSGSMPGASWTGVAFLMVMHVVVAGCAVASFRRFLPLSD